MEFFACLSNSRPSLRILPVAPDSVCLPIERKCRTRGRTEIGQFDQPIRRCRIIRTRWTVFPALALAMSITTLAAPIRYYFTAVAKTGDMISGKTLTGFKLPSFGANAPAINASGHVAFYATYSEGGFAGEGIFTATSAVLQTGNVANGRTLDGISFVPAINDNGVVVVRGLLSSQALAILTPTTLLVESGKTISGQTLTDIGLPAINDKGTVAFVGSFSSGTGIFTQTALLAKSGESIAGQTVTSFGPPAINNRGTVAFQCWFSGKISTAILTPSAVLVKTGDTIGGKTLTDLFFGPALNSGDTVAFVGVFRGGTGVFTQKVLLVQAGDTIGGQTLTSFGNPAIDDSGVVAFFATYPGGEGVFTQTSPIAKTGDTICGRTLLGVGQPAINSYGDVAFAGFFSDGSSAIILAQPINVLGSGSEISIPVKSSRP
jgi:hypothetical protein